jgi:hypothetical protein
MSMGIGGPAQSVHPGTDSLGFSHKTVIVTGLTDDGRYVCRDNFGREVTVRGDVQRAKGARPQVGEHWMISRDLGGWTLAACLSVPPTPVVAGSRAAADPVTLSLLDALVQLGLVTDETTA